MEKAVTPTCNQHSSFLFPSNFCTRLLFSSSYILMGLALGSEPGFAQPASTSSVMTKQKAKPLKVQEVKSKSGLTAWMVEANEIPVVSVTLAFQNAGIASDPDKLTGLVNLLSGMLDEGAGEWNSQEFKKFLLEKNIQLTVSASQDSFHLGFRTIKQNVGEGFRVLKTILTKPRFDKEALGRIKNQILTILQQSLHDEHSVAGKKLDSQIYGSHPYGKGTEQALQEFPAVTEAHLRKFMKDRFARDQLHIAIVGDISPDDVRTNMDETFGDLPEKAVPSMIGDATLENMGTVSIVPMDIPQSVIYFAQPGIPRNHPDFYAAMVMMKILGDGQFESRLWNEIREKRGLAYGVDASLAWSKHSSVVSGGTATKNTNVKEVIEIIRSVWQDTLKGVTQTELDFVKERMIGSFALNFSSTNKIAGALLSYCLDDLPPDYINKRNEIISSLTLDQINKAAAFLLRPDQLTFVIVGQPEGLSSPVSTSPEIIPG